MPIKLILTLALVVLVTVFTGFNLDNKCNIWLFHTFEQIPVSVTILISLLIGVLITLPFTFGKRVKDVEKKERRRAEKIARKEKAAQKKQGAVAEKKQKDPVCAKSDSSGETPATPSV